MAKIWMDDKVGLDKFDPYKDTLVTTVRGTEEEIKEVLDKLMGGKTNMPEYKTMSLIKKDDVIKAIGEEVLNVTRNMPWSAASKEMARNTLYALKQTVQEMPEIEKSVWISVKERMPETEGKYIVCTAKSSVYCTKFKGCGDIGVFKTDMNTHITHWMPLPDAPEVDDE